MTELPPLPKPGVITPGHVHPRTYTADQMRAYAAEAVRVARAEFLQLLSEWDQTGDVERIMLEDRT